MYKRSGFPAPKDVRPALAALSSLDRTLPGEREGDSAALNVAPASTQQENLDTEEET